MQITRTQLKWIEQALNHEIATYQHEVQTTDSELVRDLGAVAIQGRENLKTVITDIINSNTKRIEII